MTDNAIDVVRRDMAAKRDDVCQVCTLVGGKRC